MSDGDLPPDGEATVAGVRLPAGRRLAGTGAPVLWATGDMTDAAGTWLALADGLAGTSLVPVLVSGLRGEPERPWDSGELWPCEPGAVNYYPTPAPLSAVLRSWEDRSGARLIHLGFDTMDLLVERPVLTQEAAHAVAAEHFAFCPDNIGQGPGTIRRYAAGLPEAPIRSFWWD